MSSPRHTEALTLLREGIEAAQAGNRLIARMRLEKSAELDPANPDCWVWLAWTSESPKSALFALKHAASCDANHVAANHGLAWLKSLCDYRLPNSADTTEGKDTKPYLYRVTEESDESEAASDATAAGEHDAETDSELDSEIVGFPYRPLPIPDVSHEVDTSPRDEFSIFGGEEPEFERPFECEQKLEDEPVFSFGANVPTESVDRSDDDSGSYVADLINSVKAIQGEFDYLRTDATPSIATDEAVPIQPINDLPTGAEIPSDEVQSRADETANEPLPVFTPVEEPPATISGEFRQDNFDHESDYESAEEPRPTILAVDDSPTVRKLIAITLEKHGYQVITAEDGMAALNYLTTNPPHLVLTDINMPRLDGYQLCKLIKKHDKTKHIPVIMLSGKDGVFDRLRGRLVGCDDYITKPFESADIVQKVSAHRPQPQTTR
jgi:twitching motility two-component system response regulator PilG